MKIAKPEEMSQAELEKEILNPIVYTELKFRGWADKSIMLRFGIRPSSLKEFKTERSIPGRGPYKKRKAR